MKTTQFALFLLSGALCVSAAKAASLPLPAPSQWTLDPAASTGGGGTSAFSSDNVLTVSSFSKSNISMMIHFVGNTGKPMDVSFSGAADGRQHAYSGGRGSFREDGVYTFEQRDGTFEYGTLTLSNDGKRLTNTYTVKPRSGASTQVVNVYTRAK